MSLVSIATSTGLQLAGNTTSWPEAVQNIVTVIALAFAFYAFCKYA